MIRNNKIKIIITSIIILLPMIAGAIMWDRFPEEMAVHWNAAGEADNFMSKGFAVFGLPLILFCLHLLCVFVTALDKRNKEQNNKILGLTFWICPCISLLGSALIFSHGIGKEPNVSFWVMIFVGLMFVMIGNYLPKCTINHTIGIKLPWTVNNEAVWIKTHRLGGILWVISGFLMIVTAFLPAFVLPIALSVILILAAIIPTVYSYMIYKRTRE